MEIVTDFIFLGSKMTVDDDCSQSKLGFHQHPDLNSSGKSCVTTEEMFQAASLLHGWDSKTAVQGSLL